jgi:L-lactate permease
METIFSNITSLGNATPVVIGGVVAFFVLTALALFWKTKVSNPKRKKNKDFQVWQPPEGSAADRRTSKRREGKPVPVLLNSAFFSGQTQKAYVLDRSTGGLKLGVSNKITVGSSLMVKASNAPDTVPWITVIVRNCRDQGEHFELGCEFEVTPPWNVLLLFG